MKVKGGLKLGGFYTLECWRKGKLVWTEKTHNIVTNEGLNSVLNVYLHAATQITTWYLLLFETNTTPSAGTTYETPVFTECTTSYDEATRPVFNEAAASSQSITNSANKATFTFNATKTLYGGALVGGGSAATTKGNTAGGGTMFSAGKFTTERIVYDTDVVNLTYTSPAQDDA